MKHPCQSDFDTQEDDYSNMVSSPETSSEQAIWQLKNKFIHMKKIFVFTLMLIGISFSSMAQYADYFTSAAMRLDYNHVGNSGEEHFAFDQMVNDG